MLLTKITNKNFKACQLFYYIITKFSNYHAQFVGHTDQIEFGYQSLNWNFHYRNRKKLNQGEHQPGSEHQY